MTEMLLAPTEVSPMAGFMFWFAVFAILGLLANPLAFASNMLAAVGYMLTFTFKAILVVLTALAWIAAKAFRRAPKDPSPARRVLVGTVQVSDAPRIDAAPVKKLEYHK